MLSRSTFEVSHDWLGYIFYSRFYIGNVLENNLIRLFAVLYVKDSLISLWHLFHALMASFKNVHIVTSDFAFSFSFFSWVCYFLSNFPHLVFILGFVNSFIVEYPVIISDFAIDLISQFCVLDVKPLLSLLIKVCQ